MAVNEYSGVSPLDPQLLFLSDPIAAAACKSLLSFLVEGSQPLSEEAGLVSGSRLMTHQCMKAVSSGMLHLRVRRRGLGPGSNTELRSCCEEPSLVFTS